VGEVDQFSLHFAFWWSVVFAIAICVFTIWWVMA